MPKTVYLLAVWWSAKEFFATKSSIFRITLAEKQEEQQQHKQLQSVMRFTETQ